MAFIFSYSLARCVLNMFYLLLDDLDLYHAQLLCGVLSGHLWEALRV